MKHLKYIILGVAAAVATNAMAQGAIRSAYFMDGYTYRHVLNPAFGNDHGYVAIPVLGNFNVDAYSNMGLTTFLYKTPAGSKYPLTSFMSPDIQGNTFLNKLKLDNHLNFDLDLTLISVGFKAFGGFNTVSVGVHADGGFAVPKDLFTFLKMGQTSDDTHYNFKDIKANATGYAEIALGHSRKIGEKLDVGAKLKFLVGGANATLHVQDMDITLSNKEWRVKATGEILAAAGDGLVAPTYAETGHEYSNPADADIIDWNEVKYDHFNIAGYGAAVDLGAAYQVLPDLQVSLAVNDFGFMDWRDAKVLYTGGNEWAFEGFHNVAINENQPTYDDDKLSTQIDNLWDDVQDEINFHRTHDKGSYVKPLNATIRVGAEYTMPFYRGLTGGFLLSSYIAGPQTWVEGRFFANVKPTKWFDCSISYGASTYGNQFGWIINFHPRGFNFFIGSDHQFFNVTPQFVPTGNIMANINFGFNVTF